MFLIVTIFRRLLGFIKALSAVRAEGNLWIGFTMIEVKTFWFFNHQFNMRFYVRNRYRSVFKALSNDLDKNYVGSNADRMQIYTGEVWGSDSSERVTASSTP